MLIKIINHPRKQAIILTFTAINTEPAGAREREEIILDVVREEEETPGNRDRIFFFDESESKYYS